jgi:DNA-binding transcriptional MerR regulator
MHSQSFSWVTAMPITVAQMADRAGKSGDSKELFIQRVRHWTRERLLVPVGETNPGTGKHRVYRDAALYEALILEAMTDRGIPIATQRHIMGMIRAGLREIVKSGAKSWLVIDTWPNHSAAYFSENPQFNNLADSTLGFNLTRLFAVPPQAMSFTEAAATLAAQSNVKTKGKIDG